MLRCALCMLSLTLGRILDDVILSTSVRASFTSIMQIKAYIWQYILCYGWEDRPVVEQGTVVEQEQGMIVELTVEQRPVVEQGTVEE